MAERVHLGCIRKGRYWCADCKKPWAECVQAEWRARGSMPETLHPIHAAKVVCTEFVRCGHRICDRCATCGHTYVDHAVFAELRAAARSARRPTDG